LDTAPLAAHAGKDGYDSEGDEKASRYSSKDHSLIICGELLRSWISLQGLSSIAEINIIEVGSVGGGSEGKGMGGRGGRGGRGGKGAIGAWER
jgi:hypothetical protein